MAVCNANQHKSCWTKFQEWERIQTSKIDIMFVKEMSYEDSIGQLIEYRKTSKSSPKTTQQLSKVKQWDVT